MKFNKKRKHINIRTYLFAGAICFSFMTVQAVPAYRKPVSIRQTNGKLLTIKLYGDEHFHYQTTADGYLLTEDEKGNYNYAKTDTDGNILSLGVIASNAATRSAEEKKFINTLLPVTEEQMKAAGAQRLNTKKIQRAPASGRPSRTMPLNGSPRSLVILVNFSDKSFSVASPLNSFTNLLNQQRYSTNGGTGSAKDYFRENSNGKFNPQFDVVGPYTLPQTMAYYGGNTSGSDTNPRQMVIDACKLADAAGTDFTQYDTDNDGYVDNIFVYYAGYNEAEGAPANTIWPHRWTLANYSTKFDGKIVFDYACTSELKGTSGTNMCGVGTFVHEFGHVLGLPDLYATNSATHHTLYAWDVMDYGPYNNSGRTPPNYSSYERFFLGWLTPTEIKKPSNLSLDTLTNSNQAYLISQSGTHNLNGQSPSPTEFFMLENRQQKGWDAYLPGHGLLATRVYYSSTAWDGNTVNNTSTAMGVDIIEADGTATDASCSGDVFPGTARVTSYSPALRAGTNINKPLTNITETNGRISFQFMGGEFSINNAPVAIAATNISQTSFTANWNAVPYADTYLLDVFTLNGTDTTYITGYQLKNTGNVTSSQVTGLLSEKHYYYRLKTVCGAITTIYSNLIEATTIPYTFDMFAPVALAATDVDKTSFTAHWSPLTNADSYLISIYTKEYGTQLIDSTYGFAAFPSNWSKNFSLTYTSSTMYGIASPSLRMSYDGDYLQTAVYPNKISAAQFWYRGSGILGSNALVISGSTDGVNWTILSTIQSLQNTSQTVKLTATELGESKALKISFSKTGSGSLGLDDLKLSFPTITNQFVSGYEALSTGNVLSYTTSNLQPATNYYYRITAMNKQAKSAGSNEIAVTTSEDITSALAQNFSENENHIAIESNTIKVSGNKLQNKTIRILNLQGQIIYQVYATTLPVQIPRTRFSHGVYFIQIDTNTMKISL